jgi:TonB family protein
MICGSCRRRCDPYRSFCTHCGSSVFIDEREAASFFRGFASRVPSSPEVSRQIRALQQSAQSFDRKAVADAARSLRARTTSVSKTAPQVLRLGPFFRLAVFAFLVWYAAGWLLTIPEVLVLKERVQAGHFSAADLQAARDAVGARIQTFLRNAQDPNPPPRALQPAAEAPDAPVRSVPVRERNRSVDALSAPPEAADLPAGVSLPGDGVTFPRVLHQVQPEYTPEAIRAKVEGSVLLQAVVRTHGVPEDISVVRSLDQKYGLDQQAIAAVRQWRFSPGERNGRPVPVLVQIEIKFALR